MNLFSRTCLLAAALPRCAIHFAAYSHEFGLALCADSADFGYQCLSSVDLVRPICAANSELLFLADQLCAARRLRPQNLKRRHGVFWIEHSLQLGFGSASRTIPLTAASVTTIWTACLDKTGSLPTGYSFSKVRCACLCATSIRNGAW
jgi:hypothetical protein